MARTPVRITDLSTDTAEVTNTTPSSSAFGLVVRSVGGAVGGGSTAVRVTNTTSQRVPVALVDPISVDDNGGSLTVDGTISLSTGTLDSLETVTANAGVGPWPVTDNGGSLTVDGTVAVSNPSTAVRVTNTTGQRVPARVTQDTDPWVVKDDYQSGQVLADQTGASAVLTFNFASAVQLVVVDANGAATDVARADPFGGTPTASLGIPCRDEVPTFMPVTTTGVKVFAPSGMTVSVYGYRRS